MKIGILIKYTDDDLSKGLNSVEVHNKILRKSGKVWIGKYGLPIDSRMLTLCASADIDLLLICIRTQSVENEPKFFSAKILAAQNKRPPTSLVPSFYRKHCAVQTWFCLDSIIEPMTPKEILSWCAVSSGQPLLAVLRKGGRDHFYLAKKDELNEVQKLINDRTRKKTSSISTHVAYGRL